MKKLFLIQLLLFSVMSFAQPPTRFYTKFGGSGVDIGYSAKPTLDRHYIVAGSTSSYGNGNTDVYLIKVDSMGYSLWERTFGGFTNDVGKSVVQLPDSGYVVAGFTNSFGNGGYDVYLIRTDKNGILIWQKTFGGLDWDFANDITIAADGDLVVCGYTSSFGAGKKDGLILKYDILGNLVWQKTIGGVENEELRSVIKTSDNFLATVGYTESNGDINGDVYFYKFDMAGNTLYYHIAGGPGKDYANDIVEKPSSDYVICGAKTFNSEPKPRALMYSISSTGAFVWENNYVSNVDVEEFTSVTNSYHIPGVSGYARRRPVSGFKIQVDVFLATYLGYYYRINASGGSEDETINSIEGLPDGGYVSVGSTLSFGSIGEDVYLIRHDSTIISYTSVVGVKEIPKNNKPYILYKENKINIILRDGNAQSAEVIDLTGKKIHEVVIEESDKDIEMDMSQLTPAIYILRIRFKNGEVYNGKIMYK